MASKGSISRDEVEKLKQDPGFSDINKICDGIDIMGVGNCCHLFDPDADWPEKQEWNGTDAPWIDQSSESDAEFRSMFKQF